MTQLVADNLVIMVAISHCVRW